LDLLHDEKGQYAIHVGREVKYFGPERMDTYKGLSANFEITLKKKRDNGIHLLYNRDQGQVIINVVMKRGVTKKGNIL
jgi:hypothetical protein